jgi:hypothetical protein
LSESVLNDSTGSTFEHILQTFSHEIKRFKDSGGQDLDNDLFHALYDYYFDDMPYGIKKARTGDPDEWIADRLYSDLALDEDVNPVDIPAYRRKGSARLGNFPAPGMTPPPPGDNTERLSDLATIRKMAGLPHKPNA